MNKTGLTKGLQFKYQADACWEIKKCSTASMAARDYITAHKQTKEEGQKIDDEFGLLVFCPEYFKGHCAAVIVCIG